MNNIRATKAINEKELALGIQASWHDDYKDSAYIYIGGLDTGLTEGDVITIFSQYGEPVDINMPKAKPEQTKNESGNPEESKLQMKPKAGPIKSRGFCFLMYENQLSTNLAVDNLNGAIVLGRTLRVDHCKNYKQLERTNGGKMTERDADLGERLNALPELHIPQDKDENQSDGGSNNIDPEDPMANYLLEERKKRKKKESKKKHRDSDEKRGRKKSKRGDDEDEDDRRARKDAKRIKKLLKKIGPSDRTGESNSRSKEDRRRNHDDDRDSYDRHRSYSPPPRDSRDLYDRNYTRDDRRDELRSYKRESDSHHVLRSTNDARYEKDSGYRSKSFYRDDDDLHRR